MVDFEMGLKQSLGAVAKRPPGRPRKSFDTSQGGEILDLIRAGHGRKMICLKLGLDYKRFLRLLAADPAFAAALRLAEASREETCEQRIYQLATETYDTPIRLRAAIAYLGRRERVQAARRGREQARAAKASPACNAP